MGRQRDKTLNELIKTYVDALPEIASNNSALAQKIIEDNMSGLTHRTLRLRIAEWKDAQGDIEVKHGEDETTAEKLANPWHVIDTNNDPRYIISSRFGTINIPVSKIDKMFMQFSRHGENLTSEEIIANFDLEVWQWHAIKNALRLYKASNIYSPWTVKNTPHEDVVEMVEGKMDNLFRSKKLAIREYNKAMGREYKAAIRKENWKELELIAFKNEILKDIDTLREPVTLRVCATGKKEAVLTIADLHNGAEYDGGHRTEKFSPEELEDRLMHIAGRVNRAGYSKVHVVILGDLIESFTGLNHPNSWQGIRRGMYGAKVVKSTIRLLKRFLEAITNCGDVYITPGNHDRSTSSNKEDVRGEIAYIICDWLTDIIPGLTITNNEDVGAFEFGNNLNIIMEHGHLGLSKQKAASKAWKYGKQGKFNVILRGHLHSVIVRNDDWGSDVVQMTCPSVFGGNDYSDKGGWDGSAGYVLIEEEMNKPEFTIRPI
jgi:predicted phosphodiesterase